MTTLIVIGIAALAFAVVHARIWPLKTCPRCLGRGETGPGPHALRVCRRCGGDKRVRRLLAPRS